MKTKLFTLATLFAVSVSAFADASNVLDEFDPSAPNAMEMIEAMSEQYEQNSGESIGLDEIFTVNFKNSCVERGCKVFIDVDKAKQRAEYYVDGALVDTWKVSTARAGKITRNHNGIIQASQFRIFDAKTSTSYPLKPGQRGYVENGKDLGNMPYAVFYHGPYAFHGTTAIDKLGTPASAGCVRLHPANAKIFNRAIRANGRANAWITIN